MSYSLRHTPPAAAEFAKFRETEGWGHISIDVAETAIANSRLWVSAYEGNKLIGFVRIIGDGAVNYYVQDLIVTKGFRGQGVGRQLLTEIMLRLQPIASGATLGLMVVAGKEGFYESLGFQSRPSGYFGAGMTLTIGGHEAK